MMLNQRQLDEFKAIYLKEYGEEIDDATAREKATRLLRLMKAVYGPSSNEEES